MMFDKILVGYDGSEHSVKAIKAAEELANKGVAETVHILKIQEPVIPAYPYPVSEASLGDFPGMTVTEEARTELFRTVADLTRGCRVAVTTEIRIGFPLDGIIQAADEGDYDLIVLGSRGLGPIRSFLGSTSFGVLTHADIPVLIVH